MIRNLIYLAGCLTTIMATWLSLSLAMKRNHGPATCVTARVAPPNSLEAVGCPCYNATQLG